MNVLLTSGLLVPLLLAPAPATPPNPRQLPLEERVRAQEAVERVYYAHQIGTSLPFEEAVPRRLIVEKVLESLRQSAALERFWKISLTSGMLEREMARIAANTRLPDRLAELYAALGNDPFLVMETLVRPILVDRLARAAFAEQGAGRAPAREPGEAARTWDAWWAEVRETLPTDAVAAVSDPSARLILPGQNLQPWCSPDDTWDARTSSLSSPSPRSHHLAVWTGSVMIVWGGTQGFGGLSSGGRYDPAVDGWMPTASAGAPSTGHNAVWTGSRMIVWGSDNTGGQYDPVANVWTPTSTSGAPMGGSAVWTGSRMLVWSGSAGGSYDPAADVWTPIATAGAPPTAGLSIWADDEMIVWNPTSQIGARYRPATDSWSAMSSVAAPSSRSSATVVWTGSEMILWGGHAQNGAWTALNTGGRYRPASDTWAGTALTNAPSARYAHRAIWSGSEMIVWGGGRYVDDGAAADGSGARYDPAIDTWTPTPLANAPVGRMNPTAVWDGSRMIVWGGDGGYGIAGQFLITGSGGRYDRSTGVWSATSSRGIPSPRSGHTAVWTGTQMIVWGGIPANGGGGKYDPATDAWLPVSLQNAPSARSGHTAIWTGTRMVVWGGGTGSSALDTGGRYDPLTDSWSATTLAGAPAPRRQHTAVWTGREMIVWGGDDNWVFTSSGGRYDPGSDTWSPISDVGAPSARSYHEAVWTGSRMIVWGGWTDDPIGGRYDPAADTWAPTAALGAPVPRIDHTAVWSGDRMILWGGQDFAFGGGLASGARYDPIADVWLPTSISPAAPEPRFWHTAVWTGDAMIVWGGRGDGGLIQTGARYDPLTDAWTPISTTGAPAARQSHSAVWTGGAMLVWGGSGSSDYLNSGGIYALGQLSDRDDDGFTLCAGDCSDADASAWGTPGEVPDLVVTHDAAAGVTTLTWSAPLMAGGTALVYDAIASGDPSDFTAAGSCLLSDGATLQAIDTTIPAPGSFVAWLIRAENGCPVPVGWGSVGSDSSGNPRSARACP